MTGTVQRRFAAACVALAAWALLLAPGLAAERTVAAPRAFEAVMTQVGVIDALLAGGYQGSLSLGQLRRLGDVGLGTFDALDGELVLLDGTIYQVPASGVVRKAPDGLTTPFAQAVRTRGAVSLSPALPKGAGLHAVEALLDAALGDVNVFAAVRIDARFAVVSARSVPRQSPPYRPLAEVAKEQSLFDFSDVEGTLVGLRGPAFVKGLGVPGWHWHFLTKDRSRGGHALGFTLAAAGESRARLTPLRRFTLLLPKAGLAGLDLARDRAAELKAVEAPREGAPGEAAQGSPR